MTDINEAINSYADRAGSGGSGAAPYNSESLAEIYEPRVRQLLDLQEQGFTHAEWKWDADAGHNRWQGVTHERTAPHQGQADQDPDR